MRRKDPFPPAFDGLPLLSDEQIGGMGLFLLRVSFLLICSMPLVLSMLDAIAGIAANVLYGIGMAALCLPLFIDVIRKFISRAFSLDSLLVFLATAFLVWSQHYFEAAVFIFFYHFCDLFLCLLLRSARKKCTVHVERVLHRGAVRIPQENEKRFHLSEGEVLGADCRVISGEAICSLGFLDAQSGEFEAQVGDVLFAGTCVEEGTLFLEVLEPLQNAGVFAVRRKLQRCLNTPSKPCLQLARVSVYLQTVFLLFVLMNVTFFDIPVPVTALAFCSLFLCFDLFLRWRRAVEFNLLSQFLEKGIYPESIDSVVSFHKRFKTARFTDASALTATSKQEGGRVFRVKGRLVRQHVLIAERASECGRLIAAVDFAMMYRTRRDLEDCAERCSDVGSVSLLCLILTAFCSLFALYLLFLTGSVIVATALLFFAVFVSVGAVALTCQSRRKQFLKR